MGVAFRAPAMLLLLPLGGIFVLLARRSRRSLPPGLRAVVLGLRLVSFTLLVLALADPLIWTGTDALTTVFLLDRSASIPPSAEQDALAWIQAALRAKRPTDRWALIGFARDAAVEQGLTTISALAAPTARLQTDHTDIVDALRLAEGLFPPGGERRIVLLSDGNENVGHALDEAPILQASQIVVDTVPIGGAAGPEVAVRTVSGPPLIHQGERFTLSVTISATVSTTARLRLLIDGRLDLTRSLTLTVGDNRFVLDHDPLPPGGHTLQVLVEPAQDTLPENNVGSTTLTVLGPPQILLIEGKPGAAAALARALEATGLGVTVGGPALLGGTAAVLAHYDAVALVNVAAAQLGELSQTALTSYVRDFGGGLVVIGGDQSFGPGGYAQTPLEAILPVLAEPRAERVRPPVAVALIVENLELSEGDDIAKAAAKAVIRQLQPTDLVAISDANEEFPIPLQPVRDPTLLEQRIDSLVTGDPPSYAPFLTQAAQQLAARQAAIKHIILIGDGDADGVEEPLIASLVRQGITISTIATLTDPSAAPGRLQEIAAWGHGRFVEADDVAALPQLVLHETVTVARAATTREVFTPRPLDPTPMLAGLETLPPLRGYVATTAKPAAVVGLESPQGDPILAQWQVGLGRVVAFTSDAGGEWSADWIAWSGFSRFWGQLVRWVLPAPHAAGLTVQTRLAGEQAQITAEATDTSGAPLNDATLTATVSTPTGAVIRLPLPQSAPGEYTGTVAAAATGPYLVQVALEGGASAPIRAQGGFSVPYSPEFSGAPPDLGLLRQLAAATGGQVRAQPAQSFAHDLRPAEAAVPVWPALVAPIIPLIVLEVGLRRLRVVPRDLAALGARVWPRGARPANVPPLGLRHWSAAPAARVVRQVPPVIRSRPPRVPTGPPPLAEPPALPRERLLAAKRRAPAAQSPRALRTPG